MKLALRLALVSLFVSGLLLVVSPRSASAHPLGNFTINHYSALTVTADRVDVLYVLDMAEIPTYQELGTIRPDHSTDLTASERAAYMTAKAAELLKGLTLAVDGRALALTAAGAPDLSFPAGAGGLPTLRLVLHLSAPLGAAHQGTLTFRDDNYSERIGWKEIIAKPGAGIALQNATVPQTDLSAALTQYPPDRINDPLRVSSASLAFAPGAAAPADAPQLQTAQRGLEISMPWAKQGADALTDLINQKELPLGALLIGLLIACGAGAGHALSPGHGKTVVAAYLVGSRGTALHAILLGLIVTISHTIGVFLLGLVVLYASEYILPDQLYPWLGFASGALIAVVGVVLFWQRRRAWRRTGSLLPAAFTPAGHTHTHDALGHDHDHSPDHEHTHDHDHVQDHDHAHGHDHTHDHAHNHPHDHAHGQDAVAPHSHGLFSRPHTHVPVDGQRVTPGSLLALGITGGIIPCPSALIVLLAAVAYHQVGLGLLLILAFSVGLAAVLMGIGLLMVYSRGLLGRVRLNLGSSLLARLPMASALAVSCLGLLIAFEALNAGGILR